MTVTVVSCYYQIKSKFSCKKYLEWIANFLSLGFKAVIFTDKKSVQLLNVKQLKNIKLVIVEFKDFLTSQFLWQADWKMDHENNYHTIKLYKLWGEKIFFMQRAANLNFFDTTWYLWIDIGSFRSKNDISKIRKHKFPQADKFVSGKITMAQIAPFSQREKCNIDIIDDRFKYVNRYGGLMGGDQTAINKFAKQYLRLLKQFKSAKIFAGKDQTIYNYIALQCPDLIDTVIAAKVHPKYDPWFCFHYYFSTYKS